MVSCREENHFLNAEMNISYISLNRVRPSLLTSNLNRISSQLSLFSLSSKTGPWWDLPLSVTDDIVELLEGGWRLPDSPNEVPNGVGLPSTEAPIVDPSMTCGSGANSTLLWLWLLLWYEVLDVAALIADTICVLGSALPVWWLIWKPGGGVQPSNHLLFNFSSWIGGKIIVLVFTVKTGFSVEAIPKIPGYGMRVINSGSHSASPFALSPPCRVTLTELPYPFSWGLEFLCGGLWNLHFSLVPMY